MSWLIRPAFPVARGMSARRGGWRLLHDHEQCARLDVCARVARVAVPSAVRLPRWHPFGPSRVGMGLDDAATTSSAAHLGVVGVVIGGGAPPALGLGRPMTRPRAAHVSLGTPLDFRRCLPSLGRWLHFCRMHTLRAGPSAGRAVSGRWCCVPLLGAFFVASPLRWSAAAAPRAAAPADGRHCRSARAFEERPARSTLPPRSRRARHKTPHRKGPPTAPRATRTAASASPFPSENTVCCHCPAPDSSDGNTRARSVPAQAASALSRAFSSAA